MEKHSVALILPYYGKLPNYFPLWLKSAGTNKNFTFMIFSDIDFSSYEIPENVKIIFMTFEDLKAKIAVHLDFKFALNDYYKITEYRPMFGLIFQDWLKNFDFWGHVDPDILLGDMNKFITDSILDNYSRIFQRGHLIMYRNTEKINSFVLHELPGWGISYRDILRTNTPIGLDENILTEHLFNKFAGIENKQYDSVDFADIAPEEKQFVRVVYYNLVETIPAFRWKAGKLFGLSVNGQAGNDIEYLYLHLQKRVMNFTPGIKNEDSFLVIPNDFVKDHELTEEEISEYMKPDPSYRKELKKGFSYYARKFWGFDLRGKYLKVYPYIMLLRGKRLQSQFGNINAKGSGRLYN